MTNAYQVYTGARQLLEGYAAAMQPLCRREGLAPNGVDILLFLANNPGLDTARDICTYRGLKPGIVSFHVEKLVQEGYLLRQRPGGPAQMPPGMHPAGGACGAAGAAGAGSVFPPDDGGAGPPGPGGLPPLPGGLSAESIANDTGGRPMTQDKKFLGTEPVGRLLWRLAVPTVIAQLVNMLYNIVDRIYIGHIPETGSMALTGVGVCLPIIMIISAFAAFVSSGGAPRASIAMGRGDYDQAQRILGGCFTLQVAISLVLTAVLLIWNRPLLLAFGASGNTIEYAAQYMGVYALGTLFVELTLGLNAFITAQGFAQVGMKTVLIGAVANILLDPLFIFVLDMGVRGAALATVLSQGISCVWVISFLRGKKTLLRLEKAALPIRPRLILPCVALGTAAFIMQASESVISVCFNASLLKYGGDLAVGAMTILSSVMQFAMLPLQGIAQGAQPISSYNYGAGNAQRVRQTFWLLLKVSLGYALVLWGCIQLFPGVFARIFTPDAELVAFTAGVLRIYCGALFLMGIQIACQMTFVSIGNAPCSIIVAVLRKFVLLLPLIYLLPHLLADQTRAVFLAEPVADVIAVTGTVILFSSQFRKALRGLENDNKS